MGGERVGTENPLYMVGGIRDFACSSGLEILLAP